MNKKIKIYCFLAILATLTFIVRADNGVVWWIVSTSWEITAEPTINDFYSVPEPGLTNETMTIFGGTWNTSGTVTKYVTYSDGSGSYATSDDFSFWPDTTISWSTCFNPGSLTPINYGSFTPPQFGDASISFVSPLWGDQVATFNYSAVGVIDDNPYSLLPINPLYIPFSILPRRPLIYLSFDNSSLSGDRGQLPTIATNINMVASPFGKGIDFDSSSGIDLEYPFFQSDIFSVTEPDSSILYSTGTPNVRRNEGTVRFWFQPNWTSGSGPASGGVFFDMFSPGTSADVWTLNLTANGSAIELDNAGGGFSQPINFVSGKLYQITVTYSPTETILYTNGVQAGSTGSGVSTIQTASSLLGFRIGSDGSNKQVRGTMDEVRTYNYAMSSSQVLSNYDAESAIDTDGAGVPNIVQFENGIDPSDPPGGNPSLSIPTNASGSPVIQLWEPENAIQN